MSNIRTFRPKARGHSRSQGPVGADTEDRDDKFGDGNEHHDHQ
jgi:hypothetical protein